MRKLLIVYGHSSLIAHRSSLIAYRSSLVTLSQPVLIIVSGLPCTGKTTLARRLAAEVRLPLVEKDGIKERLFDTLGWSDRAWSRRVGGATYELLFHFTEVLLAAGQSLIVESNFYPDHAARFLALQAQYPFAPLQVVCRTEGAVLWRRFQERSESGERHPGHVDQQNYAEFRTALLRGESPPLALDGPILPVDTTDFAVIDYARLFQAVREVLSFEF
jgi:predicted kinase